MYELLANLANSEAPLVAALSIGVLSSISICPLGANLAALAFINRKNPANAKNGSLAYAFGRGIAYMVAAGIAGFLGSEAYQFFVPLQQYSSLVLALVLGLAGLVLLGKMSVYPSFLKTEMLEGLAEKGLGGAFLLGIGLAFFFCPIGASLFLGGVFPLTIKAGDFLFIPLAYGFGSALPIVFISHLGAFAAGRKKNSYFEHVMGARANTIIGVAFLAGSAYYILRYAGIVK
ncbi:MAG: sulfite exporter TauE/SafE family protein [Candidatus ainarchaeum sp.]|nr:sulfite exporter TauE/SafE family protein [Candidatus ainarchaeum sp.]